MRKTAAGTGGEVGYCEDLEQPRVSPEGGRRGQETGRTWTDLPNQTGSIPAKETAPILVAMQGIEQSSDCFGTQAEMLSPR